MGVDKIGVDEVGVDEIGSRQNGTTSLHLHHLEIQYNLTITLSLGSIEIDLVISKTVLL